MRGEQSPNGLHYAREHLSCKNYMTDIDTGFKYIKFDTEKCIEEEYTHKNYLLFFLEGDFSVYCNQFCNRTFHSNEMVVLPKSSMIKISATDKSQMLAMAFDIPQSNCDKLLFQGLSSICENIDYDFSPIPMRYPLMPFLETAVTGNLSLQIYNKKVENIGHYTVLPTPRVITVTSDSEDGEGVADTGDKVTITGENFGTDPSDISVSFNGTPAEFELVDESTIVATTPADYQTGSVTVTIHGYTMTGGAMFNPNSKGDVTVLYLQNYKQPFAKANDESWKNGEWWTPAVWNQNAASFNAKGNTTVSGMQYKSEEGLTLAFQNGWDKEAYTNGKMWQVATLRPGKYRLEVTYAYTLVVTDAGNFISVLIAKGDSESDIPNVADLEQLNGVYVAYDKMGTANDSGTLVTPSFEVTETTDVVIGFLTSLAKGNSYFKVTELKLILE